MARIPNNSAETTRSDLIQQIPFFTAAFLPFINAVPLPGPGVEIYRRGAIRAVSLSGRDAGRAEAT
jgi:hypothetical protein